MVALLDQRDPGEAARLGALSKRDAQILALTQRLLRDEPASFAETVRALRAATEELIPAGRVFHLGSLGGSPVIGSLISRVGIVEDDAGVRVVRVAR